MFGFNVDKIRKDFPVLSEKVIYFDNACMSLKPKCVVEKMNDYYEKYPACGGRSGHFMSRKVDEEVDAARREVAKLIGAASSDEIIFTKNATEGINLVANAIDWKAGDEVIVSDKEHNSNLIPWLKLKELGVVVKICKGNEDGTFNLRNFGNCFSKRTKLVAVVHISNLDGVENPVADIVKIAHEKGAWVLVDGAQSVAHKIVDVKKLGIDFLAFSGHKALGPTGVGVLYGKKDLLNKIGQFIVGGQTVLDSNYESYDEELPPKKFEAGLQNYAGIIGMGEACKYLRKVGFGAIEKQEAKLNALATSLLAKNEKISILGPSDSNKRSGIFAFNVKGMKAHDVAKMLDASKGIAVRSGAFCVHSWFNARKLDGAVRASFYFYNTEDEVRAFVKEVEKICELGK